MTRTRKFFTISAILFALYTLFGFLLFPFLVRYFGERALQTHVNEASVIEKVRFNPFTWSLRVEGLSTADAGGAWTAKWALAEVNLSALTVLKFYPVLDRVVLDGLDMEATRQLAEAAPDEAPVESPEAAEGWRKIMERLNQAEIPKLRIDLLEVSNGKAGFTDHTNAFTDNLLLVTELSYSDGDVEGSLTDGIASFGADADFNELLAAVELIFTF